MCAARIYRYLVTVKRSGRVHGISLPGRDPNDLTIPCPLCPWVDVNIPSDFREKREKYVLWMISRMVLALTS